MTRTLTHLERLEAESIQIMREAVAESERPVMLYSIGKDSSVMLHLARKAFYPSPPPFPLLHVDTTWKFRAMYEIRDRMAAESGMELLVYQNPECIERGINPFDHGSALHTDLWKTEGLKQALDKCGFDAAFGGARRDEEKSRAKERIFSHPLRAAPVGSEGAASGAVAHATTRGRARARRCGCSRSRTGPSSTSGSTSTSRTIPIVPLYFAAPRPVVERDGTLIMVDDERMPLAPGEEPAMRSVRFRTLGCYPLTGAVESEADDAARRHPGDAARHHLRTPGPADRHDSSGSMEKKKQEGYF